MPLPTIYDKDYLSEEEELKEFEKQKFGRSSDQSIKEQAINLLSSDKDIDSSEIEIVVRHGTVLLSGTVRSRDDRFRAEMAIESIKGVENIINNIKLRKFLSH